MKKYIAIILILLFALPNILAADDTEIYGAVNVGVKPNVVILFDNSGSMDTDDVPVDAYDPDQTYSGSYTTNKVYHWVYINYRWRLLEFADDISDLNCATSVNSLKTSGTSNSRVRSDNYACGGTTKYLRLGNFLNYDAQIFDSDNDGKEKRIVVAKRVVTNLIEEYYDDVNFGLAVFQTAGYDHNGGRILKTIGTSKDDLKTAVDNLDAETWTPLAETLAEIGLYYAGEKGWFTDTNYTSPIEYECQKNYVIIVTDGEPTKDEGVPSVSSLAGNGNVFTEIYLNGLKIEDNDNDGHEPGGASEKYYGSDGTDYLDDVAKFLYDNDLSDLIGADGKYEVQNVLTYTIGFKTDIDILSDAAVNGHGDYFTASSYSALEDALRAAIDSITAANAVFVAPAVPVSRMNSVYAGDNIYIGFFRPSEKTPGNWDGNLKKYKFETDPSKENYGEIVGANGVLATDPTTGAISSEAWSFWSSQKDGPDVLIGGVRDNLVTGINRTVYTYNGSGASLSSFSTENADLDSTVLGVPDTDTLINLVRNQNMGDIIHSEPAIVHYSSDNTTKSYIFVGSNEGLLHCFDDDDGTETWAFVLPDQLATLQTLTDDVHDYFVDGSPSIYYKGDNLNTRYLIVGERRGGSSYSALDITSPTEPKWHFGINDGILNEPLGQSWSQPRPITISTGLDSDDMPIENDVFLLTGGYDTNQDLETPEVSDTMGRAVFAVDVDDGSLITNINFNAVDNNLLGMTHSIVDSVGIDHNGNGVVSRIYAGDTGGNLFGFKDDDLNNAETAYVEDGIWDSYNLFDASHDGTQRKIFYAPDVVRESGFEYLFFGTGDRTNPTRTDIDNYFIAVKNRWDNNTGTPWTMDVEEDLFVDVTGNEIQQDENNSSVGASQEQIDTVRTNLVNSNGWYIELEDIGEKIVSSPVVYKGVAFFTTFTPGEEIDSTIISCNSPVRGTARLYAVNIDISKAGTPAFDFDSDGDIFGKSDRSINIGSGIPSGVSISVTSTGAKLLVGVEGGLTEGGTELSDTLIPFYWRQIIE
ncbi:MAG: hypothetical protein K9L30_09345 [Desulfobacterales bacterium]|nr:hypothetical protein [Desulfobacterales bacterium]